MMTEDYSQLYGLENALITRTIRELVDDRVETIGDDAFCDCSALESINFPNVNYIGEKAFKNCSSLQSITIPKDCVIGEGAFSGCESLSYVRYENADNGFSGWFIDTGLTTLVLTPDSMISAPAKGSQYMSSFLSETPIANGTGYIYVPEALLEDYKTTGMEPSYSTLRTVKVTTEEQFVVESDIDRIMLTGGLVIGAEEKPLVRIYKNETTLLGEETIGNAYTLVFKKGIDYEVGDTIKIVANHSAGPTVTLSNIWNYTYYGWSVYRDQFRAIEDYPEICGGE